MEEFVGIDTETTGLDPETEEIVEVYARRFDSNGTLKEEFFKRCRPLSGSISKEASAVHGIKIEDLDGCPSYLKEGVQKELAEFIGKRTLVGHNLINFDIKFLKLKPVNMEDTLLMCRKKYNKGNNLASACERIGIKFDRNSAHTAKYDVTKMIELFLRMKNFEEKKERQISMFVDPKEIQKAMLETQIYSYSRINLFIQCPFKWHKRYIEHVMEPPQAHLLTGSICHRIAELSAIWCYRETLASKFVIWINKKKIILSEQLISESKKFFSNLNEPDIKLCAYYLYAKQEKINEYFKIPGIVNLIVEMNKEIGDDSYEKCSMPDLASYDNISKNVFNQYRCNNIDIIKDVAYIMAKFYQHNDFSTNFGQVALVENKMAFKKDWSYNKDWNAPDNFFRGIIDLIEYIGNKTVMITDYKTSRVMLTIEQLKHDMQLKIYALLLSKFLPAGSIDKIIIRINYLRYNRIVEHVIENIETIVKDAQEWIEYYVDKIEKTIISGDKDLFKPSRNEYCSTCFLAEEGACPLFNKKHINNINDIESFVVADVEDCVTAWKRIEANKMETKNLVKKCKDFLKGSDIKIEIDKNAKLDFWAKESRSFDVKQALQLFLKKGLQLSDIIYCFSLPQSGFDKLIERNPGISFTKEEIESISEIKISNEFDALTEKEAKDGGYLNS